MFRYGSHYRLHPISILKNISNFNGIWFESVPMSVVGVVNNVKMVWRKNLTSRFANKDDMNELQTAEYERGKMTKTNLLSTSARYS